LHTNSYDEAYATPSEEAVTTALRTQQVLAYESGIADIVDPLGGSYALEKLTQEIIAAAEKYISKIDALGGALKAIEKGFPQREIQEASYRYQQEIEKEERIIVGVNKFVTPYAKLKSLQRVNAAEAEKQIKSLTSVKKERDNRVVSAALENLKTIAVSGAASSENTMPAFIHCVEAYASIGEICDTLRGVFGVQRESMIF
jgi:methylmalonyl-CoA mutase, N-terminal domain